MLAAAFRGPVPRVLRTAVLGLLAAAGAVALAWVPLRIAADADDRAAIDTVLVSLVLLIAGLVPLFANRRHLEPRQFGWVPARPAAVAAAMLVSTLFSWPTLWLLLWLVSLGAMRPEWRSAGWALAAAGVLVLLLAVCGARVSSALSKLLVPPQGGGTLRAVGALLLVAVLPAAVFAVAETLRAPGGAATSDAAGALGWTPIGAPVAGLALAVDGDAGGALVRFGISLAWVLVLVAAWFPLVRLSVQSVARPADQLLARRSMGWFDRFPARPAAVIGARSVTYWARDPRYRVALLAAPVGAALVVLALWIAGVDPQHLALVPLPIIVLMLGWSLHNDIATDSTAIWMHIASGTRGRHDRAGRLAPVLLVGLPLVLVGSSLTVTVMGDWRVLPAVVGLNLAVLLVASGVSSVFSALTPYPTTRPGESPFSQPAVSGSGAGVAQTVSILVSAVLAAPPVWFGVSAALDPELASNAVALLLGVGYGAVVLVLGVLVGGRVFDRTGPDYVALTQTFD
jgi:ABC-2 type transport system permease protein